MKQAFLIAACAGALLVGCGDDTPEPASPETPFGAEGSAQTPPGTASDPMGNKAPENTTDGTPTQRQLDPAPEENKPGGTTTP